MKKLFAILLALALMLTGAALAEAAAAAQTVDFGDFTLAIPANYIYDSVEKVDGQICMVVYDANNNNLACTWMADYVDLASEDLNAFRDEAVGGLVQEIEASGGAISNLNLSDPFLDQLGGRTALILPYTFTVDLSGAGVDQQIDVIGTSVTFSDAQRGTYTFPIVAYNNDQDAFLGLCMVLDSITWKN